ncbi:MAG: homoprotocatechuate degradation operon regulator HpaR [Burkholderiales bacterium]|nr:homoprotocatechuate degradation operon regulator HpaR [Burkholderiales bacterium]
MSRAMRAFSRSLPMLLLRSHQAVMAQFRPVLRAHGITEQQWRVLRALSSVDEARITRLAELTLISKPSLSRLLPALEARRLVRRSAAADDARGASIRIAPAGVALIERVAPHSESRYRAIGEAVGDEALAGLYELLPRLAERLEAGVAEPAAVAAPRRTAKAGAPVQAEVPRRGRRAQA